MLGVYGYVHGMFSKNRPNIREKSLYFIVSENCVKNIQLRYFFAQVLVATLLLMCRLLTPLRHFSEDSFTQTDFLYPQCLGGP